jgi:hypothetical protein
MADKLLKYTFVTVLSSVPDPKDFFFTDPDPNPPIRILTLRIRILPISYCC